MPYNPAFVFLLAFAPALAGADSKWQFAGESQGITFRMQIRNQCQDDSKITIKLKSTLDHPAVVSFRLNDSDWRKTFTHRVAGGGKEASVSYAPVDGSVCHPFIDQIYLVGEEETVTQSTEGDPGAP